MSTEKYPYWVTATDSFMSGWGPARGKDNKLAIACDSMEEAETVKENLDHRDEMKYVSIRCSKPYASNYGGERAVHMSYKTKEDDNPGNWWTPGAFR